MVLCLYCEYFRENMNFLIRVDKWVYFVNISMLHILILLLAVLVCFVSPTSCQKQCCYLFKMYETEFGEHLSILLNVPCCLLLQIAPKGCQLLLSNLYRFDVSLKTQLQLGTQNTRSTIWKMNTCYLDMPTEDCQFRSIVT